MRLRLESTRTLRRDVADCTRVAGLHYGECLCFHSALAPSASTKLQPFRSTTRAIEIFAAPDSQLELLYLPGSSAPSRDPGLSDHVDLRGIEDHWRVMGAFNRIETISLSRAATASPTHAPDPHQSSDGTSIGTVKPTFTRSITTIVLKLLISKFS